MSVAQASQELLDQADLVIVGGPTHMHGMSRPATRRSAIDAAGKSGSCLTLDPFADRPGLREWLDDLGYSYGPAAAFDTRMSGPALFTGRASKAITGLLRQHGFVVLARPGELPGHQGQQAAPGPDNAGARMGRIAGRPTGYRTGAPLVDSLGRR